MCVSMCVVLNQEYCYKIKKRNMEKEQNLQAQELQAREVEALEIDVVEIELENDSISVLSWRS